MPCPPPQIGLPLQFPLQPSLFRGQGAPLSLKANPFAWASVSSTLLLWARPSDLMPLLFRKVQLLYARSLSSDYKRHMSVIPQNKPPPSLDVLSCSPNLLSFSLCPPPPFLLAFLSFTLKFVESRVYTVNYHFSQFPTCTSTYCNLAPAPSF